MMRGENDSDGGFKSGGAGGGAAGQTGDDGADGILVAVQYV